MWNQEQEKYIFPGHSMDPPLGSSVISNGDYLAESTRKRKAGVIDRPDDNTFGIISQPGLQYNWSREANQQYSGGAVSGMNIQGNTLTAFSNQTPHSANPDFSPHQNGRYQFQSLNNNENFPKVVSESVYNFSSNPQPHSNQNETLYNLPPEEISTPTDFNQLAYSMVSTINKDMAQLGNSLHDNIKCFVNNKVLGGDSSFELHNTPSGNLGSYNNLQIKNDGFSHHVSLGGRTFLNNVSQNGSSIKENQDILGTRDISSAGMRFLKTQVMGRNETPQFNHNFSIEVRTSTPLDNGEGALLIGTTQSYGDSAFQVKGKKEGNMTPLLLEEFSPKNIGSSAKIWDGESKSRAGTIVEKLWDGPLQLSSSVTVSAVAFFKSGEKAPEVVWSKSIEVRGKVRLEAFEKYIQELPRSRSRALMVTSLCWKVGSSESGFTGMKEVAKNYKEGRRVGFAHLYPGTDIYVCPRSDTIITILAKYGFFNGMAALEDDQNSLIGCVVWKRDSAMKSVNLLEQPLDSTPNLTSLQQAGGCLSQLGSEIGFASLENQTCTEIKKPIYSQDQIEVKNSFGSSDPNLIPKDTPVIAMTVENAMQSESEQSYANFQLPNVSLPGPPQTLKTQNRFTPDDDDLPEFDFRMACGVSLNRVSFSSDPKFASDEADIVSGHTPALAMAKPVTTPNQQISQEPTFPWFALDTNNGILSPKKAGMHPAMSFSVKPAPSPKNLWEDDDDDMPEWCPPNLGPHRCQPLVTSTPSIPSPPSSFRNESLLPPPPLPSGARPSQPLPSGAPPPPPLPFGARPPLPLPSGARPPPLPLGAPPPPPLPSEARPLSSILPPQQPQGSSFTYQQLPVNIAMDPIQNPSGYNFIPTLRPPSNMYDVRPVIEPAGWRGWKP